ncbi:hypothetical protein [Aliamphritea spongicola]|nr:hypothetical protein [Aliamphritea spongicola]
MHAISGIDIALWDLLGKLENKPVSELLGQPVHQRLPAYTTVYPLGRTGTNCNGHWMLPCVIRLKH